jgi:CheY-like chemotaxis protein
LRLLGDCHVALVHATDERQLLNDLCHLVVSACGYQMGWVGLAMHDAGKSVQPVAQFGHEAGFLKNLQISWDAEQPIGQGPVGTAIRSGTTQINQDVASNPNMAPWREAALQLGFQSSVTLPLLIGQQVLGTLTLYSAKPQNFDHDEVKLLEELASDMAFGLQSMRARSELARYQQQLEERVTQRTQEIALLNTELITQTDAATSRLYGGSGLGLTISDRLARLMGGEIHVNSILGAGSEFRFEVTLALGHPVPVTLSAAIPPNLHILIVDDHPLTRTLLIQTCAGLGWQATAVDSASAALQALRYSGAQGSDYDLILLDWHMPDMDGLEMLHQAHVSGDIGLPLVVVLAPIFELEQAVAASDSLNLDGIVTKPLTPASLLDAVTRAYTGEDFSTLALITKTDLRLAGLRLLVAEDNPLNQEVIKTILSNAGAQVVLVDNGLLAVEALRSPHAIFDAVLMDLQMPVMDGFTATRIIREELGRVDLPIIAVTAYAQAADREKTRLVGMMGHITKPLDISNLLAILALEPVIEQPMPAALPLPGLDIAAALLQFGGNKKKYQDVLIKFKLRHSADVTAMRRLHQATDNVGAIQLAHTIGGIAAFLQAPEVARLAAATETALLADQANLLPFLFDELQIALLDLGLAIDQFTAS